MRLNTHGFLSPEKRLINCFHAAMFRVVSNYVQDSLCYVPVQDVVKAFKKDFNMDITYKECHQLVLSAYASPRNRLIPKKSVRVSSVGQQYVYRGISPINKDSGSSSKPQVTSMCRKWLSRALSKLVPRFISVSHSRKDPGCGWSRAYADQRMP